MSILMEDQRVLDAAVTSLHENPHIPAELMTQIDRIAASGVNPKPFAYSLNEYIRQYKSHSYSADGDTTPSDITEKCIHLLYAAVLFHNEEQKSAAHNFIQPLMKVGLIGSVNDLKTISGESAEKARGFVNTLMIWSGNGGRGRWTEGIYTIYRTLNEHGWDFEKVGAAIINSRSVGVELDAELDGVPKILWDGAL